MHGDAPRHAMATTARRERQKVALLSSAAGTGPDVKRPPMAQGGALCASCSTLVAQMNQMTSHHVGSTRQMKARFTPSAHAMHEKSLHGSGGQGDESSNWGRPGMHQALGRQPKHSARWAGQDGSRSDACHAIRLLDAVWLDVKSKALSQSLWQAQTAEAQPERGGE